MYTRVENISQATHWIASNQAQIHPKTHITHNTIYKLFLMPDTGWECPDPENQEYEYWIANDEGNASMIWLCEKGDFINVKGENVEQFTEKEFFGLAKEERTGSRFRYLPKKFHELTGKELELLLSNMGKKAIKKAHAAGLPTTHGDGNGIFRLYPDGHKKYIKE